MTQILPVPVREAVSATARRSLTPARKRRCHLFWKGLCAVCGLPVALKGPSVRYDHEIPVWTGGADDDGPNLRSLHRDPCDKTKTRIDVAAIAKCKRLAGETCTKRGRPIPQRANPWPPKGSRRLSCATSPAKPSGMPT